MENAFCSSNSMNFNEIQGAEMANAFFSSTSMNLNEFQGRYGPLKGRDEEITKVKEDHLFGMEGGREMGPFPFHNGFHQEETDDKIAHLSKHHHRQPISDYGVPNNFHFTPLPLQPIPDGTEQEINIQCQMSATGEPKKEQPYPFSVTALELLSNYASSSNEASEVSLSNLSNQTSVDGRKLSTEEIMRVAGERYIQFSTQRVGDFSIFMHPYGFALLGLSIEETRDVELAQLLLSAAEKVSYQQFDRASRFLDRCDRMASDTGNPVQRIVYYFAEGLRERIDRETGRIESKRGEKPEIHGKSLVLGSKLECIAYHQEIPFLQAIQFAGMQAIIENVASATKVHLIDLQIRYGTHWTILMQALAERDKFPIKLLKLTAVGTTNKQDMEENCKRLESFAESLNLPFSFKIVFLSDMKDIKAELIETEADEAVAVYSPIVLRTMISRPDCLDNLMRVIKRLKPVIMVLSEMEGSHNSPSFVKRFTEALFFHSAFFDCFEACMKRGNSYRMILEGVYFRDGIRNMVATDGPERFNRSVKIEVWRAFFARFGMVEIELSESALYQARFVVNQFDCKCSCTLEKNDKCLMVGWKGTPLHSLSTWKFS